MKNHGKSFMTVTAAAAAMTAVMAFFFVGGCGEGRNKGVQ